MNRLVLICISSILVISCSFTQNVREAMALANEAFLREQFDSAAILYQRLLENGWQSADLYFNLGVTQYKVNDLASARFNLEKARLLDPNDKSIIHNLEKVKDKIGDYYVFPAYPLFGLVEWIHSTLGHTTISWFLFLLYLGVLVTFWRWRRGRHNTAKIIGFCLLAIFLSILVIFLFEQTYFRFHADMAVVSDITVLWEKPDELSSPVRDLQPGFKVRIHEIVGEWATIELADGSVGWLKQDMLLPLSRKTEAGG